MKLTSMSIEKDHIRRTPENVLSVRMCLTGATGAEQVTVRFDIDSGARVIHALLPDIERALGAAQIFVETGGGNG